MALYSVWDWNKNLYRVHSNATPISVGVDPKPPRPAAPHQLGAVPYEHAKVLPAGTRFMGLSHVPRGEIVREAASVKELLGLGEEPGEMSWGRLLLVGVAGAVAGFAFARAIR